MDFFPVEEPTHTFPGGNHATSIVEGVGMFLFALYHIIVIIVLVNMLIAMMSHSFEDIQVSIDLEPVLNNVLKTMIT